MDYVTALWIGRQLEDAGFLWYEEPMREYDLLSYTELCSVLDIPILGAETCEGAHWNVATWINMQALDMVSVSTRKGGYTGAIRVAHLAEAFGMRAGAWIRSDTLRGNAQQRLRGNTRN